MAKLTPKRVILHCSATPDYPPDNKAFDLIGASDIDVWHTRRGWSGIGYHFVIRQSGILESGRSLKITGAHVRGKNHDSIGVCYIGRNNINPEQVKTLGDLYLTIKEKYGITWREWFCHYEFSNKECPGLPKALLHAYLRLL